MRALLLMSLLSLTAQANHREQLKDSLATWKKLRTSCNGTYSYRVETQSWVGFRSRTEITVVNNVVVKRSHYSADMEQPTFCLEWEKTGKTLETHRYVAPPKTLDELYADAAAILKRRLQPGEELYVKFDSRGLLQHCFYVDTGIADDSPTIGVFLASLSLAKAPGKKPSF